MNDLLGQKLMIDGEIYEILGVNKTKNELMTIKGSLSCGVMKFIRMECYESKDRENRLSSVS